MKTWEWMIYVFGGFSLGAGFMSAYHSRYEEQPTLVRVRVLSIQGSNTLVEADDGQRVLVEGLPWGAGERLIGQEFIVRRELLPDDYRPFTQEELTELE